MAKSVLIIDDNEKLCKILCKNFEENSFRTYYALDTAAALRILDSSPIDVVLLDIRLGNENGISSLQKIREKHLYIPVIMITAYGTIETAVKCLKIGAADYVQKPINFSALFCLVKKTIQNSKGTLKESKSTEHSTIVTQSNKMFAILEKARRLASTDFPILILGESGTGKELLADFIHENSPNSQKTITRINCSAFPESLLENELFGHDKGAFTNAHDTFQGVFEQADKGTLFLDEIGDMALTTQSKILRTMQNGEVRRLGGKSIIKVNVRMLTATNRNLEEMIENGSFRADLFYRLNTATITLPPLRERKEDILLLSNYILKNDIEAKGINVKDFSGEVMDLFLDYDWPGNIRELRNTIMYSAAITESDTITLKDLPASFIQAKDNFPSSDCIQEHERKIIEHTLAKTGYNKKQTAELLNISRRTLYNKIEKYNIEI